MSNFVNKSCVIGLQCAGDFVNNRCTNDLSAAGNTAYFEAINTSSTHASICAGYDESNNDSSSFHLKEIRLVPITMPNPFYVISKRSTVIDL